MAWRLKHSTPKIWHAPGVPPTEPTLIHEAVMEISEKAARQQLAFYVQGWRDEDPENRHVTLRDGLNASAVERPDGCACRWCRESAEAPPEHALNLAWWRMGGGGGHTSSHIRLRRTSAPQPRATTEQYRIVDRVLDDRGQVEAGRDHTLWSKHFTKAEAQKGLVQAVGRWRNGSVKTAVRHSSDSYMLRWSRRDYSLMLIERI